MKAPELRKAFIPYLEVLDRKMGRFGFKRHPRGIFYARRNRDVCQKVHFDISSNPSYSPGSIAHLYPRISVEMKSVGAMAERLIAGNPRLADRQMQLVYNDPLDFLVPKDERLQWYAADTEQFATALQEVMARFECWGLPFLEVYWGPEDFITTNRIAISNAKKGALPMLGYRTAIQVIAAYLVLGRYEQAVQYLEARFSSLGAKKKYGFLFENLPLLIEELKGERA